MRWETSRIIIFPSLLTDTQRSVVITSERQGTTFTVINERWGHLSQSLAVKWSAIYSWQTMGCRVSQSRDHKWPFRERRLWLWRHDHTHRKEVNFSMVLSVIKIQITSYLRFQDWVFKTSVFFQNKQLYSGWNDNFVFHKIAFLNKYRMMRNSVGWELASVLTGLLEV